MQGYSMYRCCLQQASDTNLSDQIREEKHVVRIVPDPTWTSLHLCRWTPSWLYVEHRILYGAVAGKIATYRAS